MATAGIITEFNPFHNGHEALIHQTRAHGATNIVIIMSGNFVQRGTPAITTKWVRTKAALLHGADVVLELPVPYATATADHFAKGAVSLLKATGVVDTLAFGSESGDAIPLQYIAKAVDSPAFSSLLPPLLETGMGFAAARSCALTQLLGEPYGALAKEPNNLLAIEYLRSAKVLGWDVDLLTIPRVAVGHHGTSLDSFASATHLRTFGTNLSGIAPFVPKKALALYETEKKQGCYPVDESAFAVSVLSYLRRLPIDKLKALPDLSEGIEHLLYNSIQSATTLPELYDLISSKRYPRSRARRLVLSAFLGLTATDVLSSPPYLRLLGFRKEKEHLISAIAKKGCLPFSHSLKDLSKFCDQTGRLAELEAKSTDLYTLCLPKPMPMGSDYFTPILVL